MADDYIEIKEYSEDDEDLEDLEKKKSKKTTKKSAKKSEAPKKKDNPESDYTWIWIVLILAAIAVSLIIVFTQPKAPEPVDNGMTELPEDDVFEADQTLATVNGEPIMESELNKIWDRLPEQQKMFFTKELLLEQMVNEELLMQEAEAEGIEITEEQVEEFINMIKLQVPPTTTWEDFLAQQGITEEELLELVEEDLLKNELINVSVLSEIEVTEEEIEEYFDEQETGNLTLDEVREQIENILLVQKQSEALEAYIAELNAKAEIEYLTDLSPEAEEVLLDDLEEFEEMEEVVVEEVEEETTEEVEEETTTTTLPEEEEEVTDFVIEEVDEEELEEEVIIEDIITEDSSACVEEFGIMPSEVIFYYTTRDTYSNSMSVIVQNLESEGLNFYWADYFDADKREVVDECFDLEDKVPQFICPMTGEISVGTLREASLRLFVANCI